MGYKSYKATTDGGQLIWYPTFKAKLPTYATALNISAPEVTACQASCDEIVDAILDGRNKETEAAMARAIKRQTQSEEGAKVAALVARLKTSAGYTDAIGADLGVIGSNIPLDPLTYRPLLRVTPIMGGNRLSWVRGDAEAMKIYRRLKGQADWTELATSTSTFYDDRTPLAQPNVPEVREYMVCGIVNDEEVGQPSDIVSAVFAG